MALLLVIKGLLSLIDKKYSGHFFVIEATKIIKSCGMDKKLSSDNKSNTFHTFLA